MVFNCDSCGAQYKIADEKVTGKGVRVKCKKCGTIIIVKSESRAPAYAPAPEAPAGGDIYGQQETVVQKTPYEGQRGEPAQGGQGIEDEATRVVQMGAQPGGVFSNLFDQARGPEGAQPAAPVASSFSSPAAYGAADPASMAPDLGGVPPEDEDLGRVETRVFTHDDMARVSEERQMAGSAGSDAASYFQSSPPYQQQQQPYQPQPQAGYPQAAYPQAAYPQAAYPQPEPAYQQSQPPYQAPAAQQYVSQKPAPAPRPRVRGEWYVAIGEVQVGPLSLIEVEEKWGRGEIDSTTLVWKAGFPDWKPLMYVPELAHLIPPAPQPEPDLPKPDVVIAPSSPAYQRGEGARESSTPSLDEIAKQESELPFKADAEPPPEDDWKPSAGAALASLVEEELQSIKETKPEPAGAPLDLSGVGNAPAPNLMDPGLGSFQPAPVQMGASAATQSVPMPGYQSQIPGSYPAPMITQHPQAMYPVAARRDEKKFPVLLVVLIPVVVVLLAGGAFAVYKLVFEKPALPIAQVEPKKEEPKKEESQIDQSGGLLSLVSEGQRLLAEKMQAEKAAEQAPAEPEKQDEPKVSKAAAKVGSDDGTSKKQAALDRKKQLEEERKAKAEEARRQKEEAAAAKKAAQEEPKPKKGRKGCDPVLDPDCTGGDSGGGSSEPAPAPKKAQAMPDTLDQGQVLEVVKSNFPRIQNCSKQQQAKDPTLVGKMVVSWEIQRNGRTKNIKVVTPKFQGTFVASCVSSVVEGFVFPKFSGEPIPVNFPFNLKGQ